MYQFDTIKWTQNIEAAKKEVYKNFATKKLKKHLALDGSGTIVLMIENVFELFKLNAKLINYHFNKWKSSKMRTFFQSSKSFLS